MPTAEQGDQRSNSGSTFGALVLPPITAVLLMVVGDSLFPHKAGPSGHSIPSIVVYPVAFILLLILGVLTHFAIVMPLWRLLLSKSFSKARLVQYLLAGAATGVLLTGWLELPWGILLAAFILIQQIWSLVLRWGQLKRVEPLSENL